MKDITLFFSNVAIGMLGGTALGLFFGLIGGIIGTIFGGVFLGSLYIIAEKRTQEYQKRQKIKGTKTENTV